VETFERAYVTRLIEKHAGNVTRAAREARKDRRAFGRLMKKYSIPSAGRSGPKH
jgi:two-component system response regulator GlrR